MRSRRVVTVAIFLLTIVVVCDSLFSGDVHNTRGSDRAISTSLLSSIPQAQSSATSQIDPLVAGANIAVSSNPSQNEPSIAINPANSAQEVVGANEENIAGNVWLSSYNSFDGGLHWTAQEIPRNGNLSGYSLASDPSVAFDNQGRLYYSGVVFNVDNFVTVAGSIFVSRSLDSGGTYNRTVLVSTGSRMIFNDKPYLAADRSGSTFSGRIYISWTRFTSSTTSDIMISESHDNGATFSPPLMISSSSLNQGSVPIIGPSGEVYVVWGDLSNNNTVIVKSTNGGVSFSAPSIVARVIPLPNSLPNGLFRVNSFPTAAVDGINGNVYLAWSDYSNKNATISFTRSVDGGNSWSAPLKVSGNNATNDYFFPWMSVSSSRISVAFYGGPLDPSNQHLDVFFTSSNDNGVSFSPNIRVTNRSFDPDLYAVNGRSFIGDYIGIASYGNFSQAVWTDTRNASLFINDQNIFTARIGNPPVIAVTGSQSAGEGHLLRLQVTARDASVQGVVRLSADGLPAGATFTMTLSSITQANGDLSWTPAEGQGPANYNVTLIAHDSFFSISENLTLQVSDANFPPIIFVPNTQTVNETNTLTFNVSATDADGAEETITFSCNCPTGATISASTGVFTWTPREGQFGNYTISFTATDNGNLPLTDSKTVLIHVKDLPPTLNRVQPQTVEDETRLNFTVTAIDPDIQNRMLSFSLGSDAPLGSAITTSGMYTWTPTENQASKTYEFTIIVSDGTLQASEKVRVNVTEGTVSPELFVPGVQTVHVGSALTFKVNASYADIDDVQGSTHPVLSISGTIPEGATFDPRSGTFQWTPVVSQSNHQYTIVFLAIGPTGASVTKSVSVNVSPALQSTNSLPVLPSLEVEILLVATVAAIAVAIFIVRVKFKKKPLQ